MHILVREAIKITEELDAIFIGAVAVLVYTRQSRATQDIDFILPTNVTDEQLLKKRYIKSHDRYYTPRGYRADILFSRPINNIPIPVLIETAKVILVDKKRAKTIKTVSLEALIVMKYRARRKQDYDDLKAIAQRRFKVIDWNILKLIAQPTETEYNAIYSTMKLYV